LIIEAAGIANFQPKYFHYFFILVFKNGKIEYKKYHTEKEHFLRLRYSNSIPRSKIKAGSAGGCGKVTAC